MKKLFAVLMTLTLALVLLPAGLAAESGPAVIEAPEEGEYVLGETTFEVSYTGEETGDPQWAVRYGTCERNTGTVFGNVDGYTSEYTWDGESFYALADTCGWDPGNYCFVFNPGPSDTPEERVTREFVVGEYGAEWLPPITLDDWTLNENATLPIKFQLLGCDGEVITEELDPILTVYFGEDGQEIQELRFDEDEYHYIANFTPIASGAHMAVVELDDLVVGEQAFDVVEPGQANGRGKGK